MLVEFLYELQFFPDYGPDYELSVQPGNRKNHNSLEQMAAVCRTISGTRLLNDFMMFLKLCANSFLYLFKKNILFDFKVSVQPGNRKNHNSLEQMAVVCRTISGRSVLNDFTMFLKRNVCNFFL